MTRDEIALQFMTAMLSSAPVLQSKHNRADLANAAFQWADSFLTAQRNEERNDS